MIRESQAVVRTVENKDRNQLANLIHFGTYVHRHLDWRPPLGWIGYRPFLTIEMDEKLIASLACPPDPPKIAWLRVFVCSSHFSQTRAWNLLWPNTKNQLLEMDVETLAAIPLQKWIRELLKDQGFKRTHDVISLSWDEQGFNDNTAKTVRIREMKKADLPEVLVIDNLAFDPLWQNSAALLELAFDSANHATVAIDEFGIAGYQISTPTQYGIHLGRLAVHPRAQRKGIGFALVRNLQVHFSASQSGRVSVNTQSTNIGSLSLYHKAGFTETGETFPVFQYTF
jgi:ribosomal protein S18 acetylase RimI-like enzyme